MEVGKFLKRFIEKKGQITNTFQGAQWDTRYKIAEATANIDYGCDFDNDGKCSGFRDNHVTDRRRKEMCCCGKCNTELGYLKVLPNQPYELSMVADYYDEKVGFWRKKTGCALPRRLRSTTCLTHTCTNRTLTDVDRLLLHLLRTPKLMDDNMFANMVSKLYEKED